MTEEGQAIGVAQKNVKRILKAQRDKKEQEYREAEEDFVSDAFVRTSMDAPLITLPPKVAERDDKGRAEYLHKLASSLNAAAKRQGAELGEANTLLFQKEEQIKRLVRDRNNDRMMIQRQLANANAEKQKLLNENQGLYAEIRELKERLKGDGA